MLELQRFTLPKIKIIRSDFYGRGPLRAVLQTHSRKQVDSQSVHSRAPDKCFWVEPAAEAGSTEAGCWLVGAAADIQGADSHSLLSAEEPLQLRRGRGPGSSARARRGPPQSCCSVYATEDWVLAFQPRFGRDSHYIFLWRFSEGSWADPFWVSTVKFCRQYHSLRECRWIG